VVAGAGFAAAGADCCGYAGSASSNPRHAAAKFERWRLQYIFSVSAP
jgi:hypothetical protein